MYVKNYFHKSADLKLDNNSMIISDTKNRRDEYMSEVFYELYKDEFTKFKTTGKTAMLEQVGDNKIIKAMDSMGETIATLGNGGIKVPQKLFEVYLEQNQKLTGIEKTGDTTLTKL